MSEIWRQGVVGEFTVRPVTLTQLDSDCDVLIIATKSSELDAAIARVRSAPSLALPLLNGTEHMPVLRAHFGPHVIAGTITVESDRTEPGVIVHSSRLLRIHIASPLPRQRAAVRSLAAHLNESWIDTAVWLRAADPVVEAGAAQRPGMHQLASYFPRING